jgi:hypothetical protein
MELPLAERIITYWVDFNRFLLRQRVKFHICTHD